MDNSTTPTRYPTIRVNPLYPHGTRYRYQKGCRCSPCRSAQAAALRQYRAANPGKRIAYNATHREELAVYNATYHAVHREDKAAHKRTRRARRRSAPGSHTAADVQMQYERQRGKCFWCDQKVGRDYHVDHVIPLAGDRISSNGPENLVLSCPHCNQTKKNKDPMDFAGIMF